MVEWRWLVSPFLGRRDSRAVLTEIKTLFMREIDYQVVFLQCWKSTGHWLPRERKVFISPIWTHTALLLRERKGSISPPKAQLIFLPCERKGFISFTGRKPPLQFRKERFYKPVWRQWGKTKVVSAWQNGKRFFALLAGINQQKEEWLGTRRQKNPTSSVMYRTLVNHRNYFCCQRGRTRACQEVYRKYKLLTESNLSAYLNKFCCQKNNFAFNSSAGQSAPHSFRRFFLAAPMACNDNLALTQACPSLLT